jgi:hypothetical protein
MADKVLEQAVQRLKAHGGYGWLLNGPVLVMASDATRQLNAMGLPVNQKSLTSWFGDLPSAQDFGTLGRAASREDVIKMLADRFAKKIVNE